MMSHGFQTVIRAKKRVKKLNGSQQTQVSWLDLIGPSMKEAKISVAYRMAGSSPAMTIEAVAIFSDALARE